MMRKQQKSNTLTRFARHRVYLHHLKNRYFAWKIKKMLRLNSGKKFMKKICKQKTEEQETDVSERR